MGEHNRAFVYSAAIHLIVVFVVLGIMKTTTAERRALIIDFSIAGQPEAKQSSTALLRAASKPAPPAVRRPSTSKRPEQHISPAETTVLQPAAQASMVTDAEERVTAAAPEPPRRAAPASADGAPRSSAGQGAATERPEARYVKSHFAAIHNSITSRLSYPRQARRMGWAGTVKVSFVVNEDGGVSSVKVLASSGVEVLDKSAVETISAGAPYPKPPCKAEIVMPVTFRLDD